MRALDNDWCIGILSDNARFIASIEGPLLMLWTAPQRARKCQGSDRRWGGRGFTGSGAWKRYHEDRSRYCEVGLSGPWRRCGWQRHCPAATEAPVCCGVLSEGAVVPGRDRGLRHIALLVTRAQGARAHGAADAAGLCQDSMRRRPAPLALEK